MSRSPFALLDPLQELEDESAPKGSPKVVYFVRKRGLMVWRHDLRLTLY